mmetsp:Transcript_99818/g.320307  ORF Transcript_99818/g.320307 Transcript_99818/m.320307 type:complete len:86 (-) Transcript_99818:792-1049(-)
MIWSQVSTHVTKPAGSAHVTCADATRGGCRRKCTSCLRLCTRRRLESKVGESDRLNTDQLSSVTQDAPASATLGQRLAAEVVAAL